MDNEKTIILEKLLLDMDAKGTEDYIRSLALKSSISHIIEGILAQTLESIGKKWESGELALSQVYMSGKIAEEIVDAMLPIENIERKNQPKMAITVFEDSHMLGKRIVYSTIRSAGFLISDYGRTDSLSLISKLIIDKPEIIFISVLMLPSALSLKKFILDLKANLPEIKIVVGGAPFLYDQKLWIEIGADIMGHTATDAVSILEEIMKERQ